MDPAGLDGKALSWEEIAAVMDGIRTLRISRNTAEKFGADAAQWHGLGTTSSAIGMALAERASERCSS